MLFAWQEKDVRKRKKKVILFRTMTSQQNSFFAEVLSYTSVILNDEKQIENKNRKCACFVKKNIKNNNIKKYRKGTAKHLDRGEGLRLIFNY